MPIIAVARDVVMEFVMAVKRQQAVQLTVQAIAVAGWCAITMERAMPGKLRRIVRLIVQMVASEVEGQDQEREAQEQAGQEQEARRQRYGSHPHLLSDSRMRR